jgi:hypothetical protein
LSTIYRRVRELGYKNGSSSYGPDLNKAQKLARIKFCDFYSDIDWNKVVFSDEAAFQLGSFGTKVWSKNGTRRKVPKSKFCQKIMVWGAIGFNRKSTLCLVSGTLDSEKYQGVLQDHLVPLLAKRGAASCYFQQDNAPCHGSQSAKRFLEARSVNTLKWPSNSPDLNPIENLWALLKRRVAERAPKSLVELKRVLAEEWDRIPQETINNLVSSMPRRLDAVRALKGNVTKY